MHKTVRPWGVSAGKAHAGDNREEQQLFSILKHLKFPAEMFMSTVGMDTQKGLGTAETRF